MEARKLLFPPCVALLLLTACLPGPDDPIEYVERPEAVLIQMKQVDFSDAEAAEDFVQPRLTLYGDGTLIYRDGESARFLETRLPDEAIRDLLEAAVDEGFMEFAYEQPEPERATARPTTYLYVHTRDAANAVSAYALDSALPDDAGGEWDQFRKLREIVARLEDLDPVVLGAGEPREYVAEEVLLVVEPADAPNVAGAPSEWPWAAIDLAAIAPPGSGRVERVLESEEAAALGGWLPTTRFLQGERWFDVSFRPLLPFEDNFPEFDTP